MNRDNREDEKLEEVKRLGDQFIKASLEMTIKLTNLMWWVYNEQRPKTESN